MTGFASSLGCVGSIFSKGAVVAFSLRPAPSVQVCIKSGLDGFGLNLAIPTENVGNLGRATLVLP